MNAPRDHSNRNGDATPPHMSPLWPLVLILGEIAERVERHRSEEHPASADGDPPDAHDRGMR